MAYSCVDLVDGRSLLCLVARCVLFFAPLQGFLFLMGFSLVLFTASNWSVLAWCLRGPCYCLRFSVIQDTMCVVFCFVVQFSFLGSLLFRCFMPLSFWVNYDSITLLVIL